MSNEIRRVIGLRLAAFYDERAVSMPLRLVELSARLCVAEAMAAYERARGPAALAGTDGMQPG